MSNVECPLWPSCGCGTQSGPHTCEWMASWPMNKKETNPKDGVGAQALREEWKLQ